MAASTDGKEAPGVSSGIPSGFKSIRGGLASAGCLLLLSGSLLHLCVQGHVIRFSVFLSVPYVGFVHFLVSICPDTLLSLLLQVGSSLP